MPAPALSYGDAFQVRSKRGSVYSLTLLGVGVAQSGLFVRSEDGRVARLEERALDWQSFKARDRADPLRPGDQLYIEGVSGVLRGKFEGVEDGLLVIELAIGGKIKLAKADMTECNLVFKARNLKPGDYIYVRSKSGNEYRGQIRALGPGNSIRIKLPNGTKTNLRLHKVDLRSLAVLISLDLDRLFS